jgi:hypothetical protein
VNGHEEDSEPRNLIWTCRSCNVKSANTLRKAGLGRLTRQYNPAGGAETLGAWMNAVSSIKGEGGTMAIPEAVAMIHATSPAKRSEFANEIWGKRRQRGTDKPAKEIIDRTPAKQRSAFMKQNPVSRFLNKAFAGLERLPKIDPSVWDRQGVERESGDQRKAPFKGGQSAGVMRTFEAIEAKADSKFGSVRDAMRQSPERRVSLGSLHGLQAAVDARKVRGKIEDLDRTDELSAPAVARFKGKLYLLDGYHTLTALKLGGIKSVDATVANL